jgi:hypothetical protein
MPKFYGNGLAFAGLQHTAGTFEPHESNTMTMLASATQPHNSVAHEGAIEALAREAHVPIEAERWLSHRTEPGRDRGRAEETSPSAYGYPHRAKGGW